MPSVEYNDTFMTTYSTLELMRRNGIKNLFFSSTSAIYGEKEEVLTETLGDLKPISYYGGANMLVKVLFSSYSFYERFKYSYI